MNNQGKFFRLNQPVIFKFPVHYKGDGLTSFTIVLKYKSGEFIDLTGSKVRMQLRSQDCSALIWEFNSEKGAKTNTVIALPDPLNGVISFPSMLSWNIKAGEYNYDLEVTDSSGFVRTYLRGTWWVNQDITR